MAKMDLITTMVLENSKFTQGIDQVKQKTKELTDNIKGSNDVLGSLGGAMGGIAGEMGTAVSSLAGAATGIGLVVAAVGLLAKAFKIAKENADLYLASVDKTKQGEGIFTQQADDIIKKNIKREAGGVSAERKIELQTGLEMAAIDVQILAARVSGNKELVAQLQATRATLKEQNEQAHIQEKINQEIVNGDRSLSNKIPKELELKKVLLEQFDLQKEAAAEVTKNAEIEKQLKKDKAIITDNSGELSPAQKKAAMVDFETTAKAYAEKRENLINREIDNVKKLGTFTGDEMGTINSINKLEEERANAGKDYYAEEIQQNRLLSRVKKDALAEQIAAEKAFHKLKLDNMTSEAGFKLGEKDVNVGTAKNPYVEERAGYANVQQLLKPAANAVGGAATDANKIKDADKALRGYGGTLKSTIDLNNKYTTSQERMTEAANNFKSSISQGGDSFKEYGKTVANSMRQIISGLLSATIAQAIEKSVAFAKNPIIGVALGGVMAGLAATLFNSLVPKFEAGGISSGGLAMVGERGAELVNLPAGAQVFNHNQTNNMLGGNGGGTVLIKFVNGSLEGYMDYTQKQRNSFR